MHKATTEIILFWHIIDPGDANTSICILQFLVIQKELYWESVCSGKKVLNLFTEANLHPT